MCCLVALPGMFCHNLLLQNKATIKNPRGGVAVGVVFCSAEKVFENRKKPECKNIPVFYQKLFG